jgi:SAM-dependent methyltransferase
MVPEGPASGGERGAGARDLADLLALPAPASVLVVGRDEETAAALERRGLRVTRAGTLEPAEAAFDAAVLSGVFAGGADAESILAEAVRAVRPGGLLLVVQPEEAGVGAAELCAHFAGELLAVEEHRAEPGPAGPRSIWLLRAPAASPSPGGDR